MTLTRELTPEEVPALIAAHQRREEPVLHLVDNTYRYFSPLADAADEYIRWAKNPGQRVYLGIDVFDEAMRGIAPGELTLIVGYAHQGKTVLVNEVICNNRSRRIAYFTPDETRVLVLIKLTSLTFGVSAEELELRIASDDAEAVRLVRTTAAEHFPNLAVFDQGMDLHTMSRALDEVQSHWGERAELVVFDYLDLLQSSGEDVPSKANAIKAWGKDHQVPLMVLHQSSRTAGSDGAKVKIDSGGYGGEQQALHMIGVRRRKSEILARIDDLRERMRTQTKPSPVLPDLLAEAEYDLEVHRNTITFNLVKNKRPPGRLVDDVDFVLDPETGRIRPLPFHSQRAAHLTEEMF